MTARRVATILFVLGLVALAACGGGGAAPDLAGFERTPAVHVDDLKFVDYSANPAGAPFTAKASADGVLLLYFGYLSCPDVCPLTMSDLSQALQDLPAADRARVSVALVTVDPDRDSGAEVAAYLDHFFDANTHGLRAPDDAALRAAGERLNAQWTVAPHQPGDEDYEVSHTAVTYAVDDTGRLLREWPFGTPPDAVARTLRGLLDQQRST